MAKKLFLLLCVPLFAYSKVPDSGFYVDAGTGVSNVNYFGTNGTSGTIRIDGGYNLNQIIGFQAGMQNLFGTSMSNSSLGSYSVSGMGYDLSVIPNIPLGQNAPVNIFFRVGVGYNSLSAPVGNTSSFVDVLGAGVRYDISAHLGLSGEWISRGLLMQPSPSGYYENDFIAKLGFYF